MRVGGKGVLILLDLYTFSTRRRPSRSWQGGARLVAVIRATVRGPDQSVPTPACVHWWHPRATARHSALPCPRFYRARSNCAKVGTAISVGEGEKKSPSGKSSAKDCGCGAWPTAGEQAPSPCCGVDEGVPRVVFDCDSLQRSCR